MADATSPADRVRDETTPSGNAANAHNSGRRIRHAACVSCRQMKMKCEGEANNCIRCQKAGRACLPQVTPPKVIFKAPLPGPQTQLQSTTPNSFFEAAPRVYHKPAIPDRAEIEPPARVDVNPAGFDNYQRSHVPPGRITTHYTTQRTSWSNSVHLRSSQNDTVGDLPSIFSTPPVDTVTGPASPTISPKSYDNKPASFGRKRKRPMRPGAELEEILTPANSQRSEDTLITKKEMIGLVQLFCERHLPFMPCIPPEEFRDVDHLIETELPFVYAICYVTARYLLGGQEIREKLLPEISRIPKRLLLTQPGGSQPDELCTFKALCVLCHYSDLTPISEASRSAGKEDVLYWPLKSLAEMYGLRMSLHRSVQEVKVELASNPVGIVELKSFARYVYWLWLYDTANFCSIVSGTPPSIRIDSSIRAAPAIVEHIRIGGYPQTSVFAEVELCLIWDKASSQDLGLGEWWCDPDPSEAVDENLIESILKEANNVLDSWYSRWSDHIKNHSHGAIIDYLGRFTRFCITSYAIKCLRKPRQGLTSLQQDQIRRCVACAIDVLDWPLSLNPIQKDRIRYVPDSSCIMVSFCGLFVLSACQTFASCIPNIDENLEYVAEAAQLMLDLSINAEHKPHIQGTYILKRVEEVRKALEHSKIVDANGTVAESFTESRPTTADGNSGLAFGSPDLSLNDNGYFDMQPIWDFSCMFP